MLVRILTAFCEATARRQKYANLARGYHRPGGAGFAKKTLQKRQASGRLVRQVSSLPRSRCLSVYGLEILLDVDRENLVQSKTDEADNL